MFLSCDTVDITGGGQTSLRVQKFCVAKKWSTLKDLLCGHILKKRNSSYISGISLRNKLRAIMVTELSQNVLSE